MTISETEGATWNDSIWDNLDKWWQSHKNIIFNKDIFEKTINSNGLGKQKSTGGANNGKSDTKKTD